MKNSKTCPKCGAKYIVRIPGKVGMYGVGSNIMTGFSIFSGVKVTRFFCAGCGFIESWVESPKDLEKIKGRFPQA